jgi:hypothetical protein
MMTGDKDTRLIHLLRNLPERELERDLTASILQTLKPKKISLLRRLWLRIRSPYVISVPPLRLAVAVSSLAFLIFLWMSIRPGFSPHQRMAAHSPGSSLVPVDLDLSDANAKKVYVLGSFNGWRPQQYPMKFDAARRRWVIEIALPPGEYEYGFLVDDRKVIADPKAEFFKKDKFGSKNSILIVTAHDENLL